MNPVRPNKFAHVFYRTRRFEQMLAWYTQVFGARVQHRDPALAFLTYDDEHHRVALADLDVLQPLAPPSRRTEGQAGIDRRRPRGLHVDVAGAIA